ncbi:acyl-CoA dehydrogenase family protein [Variovorax ureilyticus]|uniref:Acyl-CoA dehydrogenase family protein n=1 Tax=Variovorax ureilyticus TaxID=1836198 RepID=A0ABU8VID0_9BURK
MMPARKTRKSATIARENQKETVVSAGLDALRQVVDSGLLRCAVPEALGGNGKSLEHLSQGAIALAERSPQVARILWAQRSAIEALVHSPNIAVREYLLPSLLNGECAGTLPFQLDSCPLLAEEVGNAYRLYGQLDPVANLQWIGFLLIAPIRRAGKSIEWVVLRSEEDRLRVGIDHEGDALYGSRTASVTLDGVFFRMDEWVNGPPMLAAITPVLEALRGDQI